MRKLTFWGLLLAVILPVTWLGIAKWGALGDAENSVDSYYHVALADQGPTVFCNKTFPVLTLSVWKTHFSDKELSYHFILYLIRRFQVMCSFDLDAPFYIPVMFFSLFFLTSFVVVCQCFDIKYVLVYSLMLVLISPSFTDRMLMLRPHVFSVALMLLSCLVFRCVTSWKRLVWVFLFSFFYAWSYSNPHFLLIPAVAFAAVQYKAHRMFAVLIPCVVIGGLIFGLTLHPQFPNTFLNWKIQCVDVIIQIVTGAVPVTLGNEFRGLSVILFVINIVLFLVIGGTYSLVGVACVKRGVKLFSMDTVALFLIATFFCICLLFGIRSVEYACPFVLLFLGRLVVDLKAHDLIPAGFFNRYRIVQISLLLLLLAIINIRVLSGLHNHLSLQKPLTHFAQWMKQSNIPENEVIGNLIWSDFPQLYHALPGYRFLYGIDPMFAYAVNPDVLEQIAAFRKGRKKMTPKELAELFGCRYLFVRRVYKDGNTLKKQGFRVLYEGPDGWLFELN